MQFGESAQPQLRLLLREPTELVDRGRWRHVLQNEKKLIVLVASDKVARGRRGSDLWGQLFVEGGLAKVEPLGRGSGSADFVVRRTFSDGRGDELIAVKEFHS